MAVPSLQHPAPAFKGTAVVDGAFKDISLSDYKGKYVVLFFYPMDFTFVCPTEIVAFSDRVEEFTDINCSIIAASCDSHFSHLAWINTARQHGGLGKINIPLLADKTGAIAKSYGVYNEDNGVPFRGLFIIDEGQILRQITINDLPVGRCVDETLRLVQAFQFTDKFGEGWDITHWVDINGQADCRTEALRTLVRTRINHRKDNLNYIARRYKSSAEHKSLPSRVEARQQVHET